MTLRQTRGLVFWFAGDGVLNEASEVSQEYRAHLRIVVHDVAALVTLVLNPARQIRWQLRGDLHIALAHVERIESSGGNEDFQCLVSAHGVLHPGWIVPGDVGDIA